ncbi:MAG: hypothetical protein P8N76_27775 [Pirellulaceae bacterium]|nr:hypothetical protein [Pirellulaceae bacterium]
MQKNKFSQPILYILIAIIECCWLMPNTARLTWAEDAGKQDPLPKGGASVVRKSPSRDFQLQSVRGKVVWYGEALREMLGINTVEGETDRSLAIATDDGQLLPIIEDLRGRAFRSDQRLRQMDVELRVRRYRATPGIQVIRVYEWREGQKFQVDYWCDICAIVMFETGPCACCQDHNRLRQRKVGQE